MLVQIGAVKQTKPMTVPAITTLENRLANLVAALQRMAWHVQHMKPGGPDVTYALAEAQRVQVLLAEAKKEGHVLEPQLPKTVLATSTGAPVSRHTAHLGAVDA